MAINFPNNPSNGDVAHGFTYDSTKGVWNSAGVADTAVTVVSNDSAGLGTGNPGDLKFASNRKTLHMYDGTEWDRIAGGQDADPIIITDADSSLVAGSSIDSHRQTYKVTDPEGFPISYSISYMRDSDKVFFTNDSLNLPPILTAPTVITKAADGTATYKFLTRTTESDGNGNSTTDLYKARYMGSDGARHVVSTKNFKLTFVPSGVAFTNNPTTDPYIAWTSTASSSHTRFGIPANSAAAATTGVTGNGGGWQYRWPAGNVVNWQNFGNTGGFGFIEVSGGVTWNGVSYNGFFYSTYWSTGNSQYSIRHVNAPTSGAAGEVDDTDENQGRNNDAGNVTSYFTTAG